MDDLAYCDDDATRDLVIPTHLAYTASWQGEVDAWARRLPRRVAEAAHRLSVDVGRPFEPGGFTAWVAPARLADGGDAVLKVLWRHPEPPADHPFRPLAEMARHWADELEHHAGSRAHGLDDGLVRAAIQLLRELPASGPSNVLLVTDLQATNVLAAEREPWLVIDPKPHVGDPAYDPVQHILKCFGRAAPDSQALVDRMAHLTGVDAERLRLWLFVRCVQASVNPGYAWPEAAVVAARTAP